MSKAWITMLLIALLAIKGEAKSDKECQCGVPRHVSWTMWKKLHQLRSVGTMDADKQK